MKKNPPAEIFRHDGHNPFAGEFTNVICMRPSKNGTITVWVRSDNVEGSSEDCWQEDIDSPEKFIAACQSCLEFVEFGDADVVDVARAGYAALASLNRTMASGVRDSLLAEFDADCSKPEEKSEPPLSGRHSFTTLSGDEAREKYGASMMFVGPANTGDAEESAGDEDLEVGDVRGGLTLVAKGDDFPDEWDSWLDELVEGYSALVNEAVRRNLDQESLGLMEGPEGLKAFAEKVGVEFQIEFWEGECISGQYHLGWIKTSKIPHARAEGRRILDALRRSLSA